jgi:hypothetical protein
VELVVVDTLVVVLEDYFTTPFLALTRPQTTPLQLALVVQVEPELVELKVVRELTRYSTHQQQ